MSAPPPPAATSPDPLQWRRKFLERRYREDYLPEVVRQPFEVDGVALQPAEALEKCRPDQYHIALTEYARRQGEEALENACDSFPAPIAVALYRGLNSTDRPHERLGHYRDAAESLLLFLIALVVGECRAKSVKLSGFTYPSPTNPKEKLTARKLLQDSIAHRLGIVDGILSGLSGHKGLLCLENLPLDAIRRLGELNDIRNDFSHYQTMSEPAADLVCQDMREQLADAVIAFEWLAETELVTFDAAVTGKPNVGKFELHMGHSRNRTLRERALSPNVLMKCMNIPMPELSRPLVHCCGEVFELTPYLHTERKGHGRYIWLFKKYVGAANQFRFELAGEEGEPREVVDSPATVEFKVMDELFA